MKKRLKYLLFLFVVLIGTKSLAENDFNNLFFNKIRFNFTKPKLPNTNGSKILYYPNGNIQAKEFFINNKKSGIWEFYYENGILKSTVSFSFNSQLEEAVVKNYDEKGVLISSGTMLEGEMVSLWKYYDENGKLSYSYDYTNDEIVLFNEEEKPIFKLEGKAFSKRMEEIQKEMKDDRTKSSQEKN